MSKPVGARAFLLLCIVIAMPHQICETRTRSTRLIASSSGLVYNRQFAVRSRHRLYWLLSLFVHKSFVDAVFTILIHELGRPLTLLGVAKPIPYAQLQPQWHGVHRLARAHGFLAAAE
eukprot:6198605-Pleurochrysis_carterae.AAC.4